MVSGQLSVVSFCKTTHTRVMSEARTTSRSLSEIGHLFLSSVRERQTNGAPLPKRQPPGRSAPAARLEVSVDLTPEEFKHVCGTAGLSAPRAATTAAAADEAVK